MKTHYRTFKGYKRYPGRTVYLVEMSRQEVKERRIFAAVLGTMILTITGLILWVVSLV